MQICSIDYRLLIDIITDSRLHDMSEDERLI